jgi:hypothetical protein
MGGIEHECGVGTIKCIRPCHHCGLLLLLVHQHAAVATATSSHQIMGAIEQSTSKGTSKNWPDEIRVDGVHEELVSTLQPYKPPICHPNTSQSTQCVSIDSHVAFVRLQGGQIGTQNRYCGFCITLHP